MSQFDAMEKYTDDARADAARDECPSSPTFDVDHYETLGEARARHEANLANQRAAAKRRGPPLHRSESLARECGESLTAADTREAAEAVEGVKKLRISAPNAESSESEESSSDSDEEIHDDGEVPLIVKKSKILAKYEGYLIDNPITGEKGEYE